MPNAFETYGFDFLINEDLELKLLEANRYVAISRCQSWIITRRRLICPVVSGPALEAHAGMNQDTCNSIVHDSVRLIIGSLEQALAKHHGRIPIPEADFIPETFHSIYVESPKTCNTNEALLFTPEYLDYVTRIKGEQH